MSDLYHSDLYHVAIRGKLSLPDVWTTREEAHASAVEQFPKEKSYILQTVRPATVGDMIDAPTMLGMMAEESQRLIGDASWLDGTSNMEGAKLRDELVGIVRATLNDWAQFRSIGLTGYIVVHEETVAKDPTE